MRFYARRLSSTTRCAMQPIFCSSCVANSWVFNHVEPAPNGETVIMTSNAPWHTRPDLSWERLARHRAAKYGCRVHRTRRRKGLNNAGEHMLIHKATSIIMLGAGFTATLGAILDF